MEIKADINIPRALKKIENPAFWTYSAKTWWRLYIPYVPMRTGALFKQVQYQPKVIEHTVPYAKLMYEGNFNFKKNKHSSASREWDKEAIKAKKDEILIADMQKYVDSGRLKL